MSGVGGATSLTTCSIQPSSALKINWKLTDSPDLPAGAAWELMARMNFDWKKLQAFALAEVEATLAALPTPLREPAAQLPVTFERRPNRGLQADGIEADTLGVFCGPEFADETHSPLPPQIILFLENIWKMVEADEKIFREEVRTTYLHELGHYLGLDEDELTERGLD